MAIKTVFDLCDFINEVMPNAIFDEDQFGELIIATGFKVDENNNLVEV